MPYCSKKSGARAPDLRGLRVLVADADCALYGLLEEWLAGEGFELSGACAPDEPARDGYDLIVVDVPFPREGVEMLRRLGREHPGTPIVALSAAFFPSVEASGALARELGVAAVLPKPVTREALISAASRVLHKVR